MQTPTISISSEERLAHPRPPHPREFRTSWIQTLVQKISIKGMPPLASHCGVLLVGVALCNLGILRFSTDGPPPLLLPSKHMALALEARTSLTVEAQRQGRAGHGVHVLRLSPGGACRVTGEPLRLLRRRPSPILAAPERNLAVLAAVSQTDTARLQIATSAEAMHLAPCASSSRITYGSLGE